MADKSQRGREQGHTRAQQRYREPEGQEQEAGAHSATDLRPGAHRPPSPGIALCCSGGAESSSGRVARDHGGEHVGGELARTPRWFHRLSWGHMPPCPLQEKRGSNGLNSAKINRICLRGSLPLSTSGKTAISSLRGVN
jgi:hypothetical protein